MTLRATSSLTAFAAALLLAGAAQAQTQNPTPPEKPTGVNGMNDAVGSVDLTAHAMPGPVTDYDLRARLIGIAPGGAIHSHPHAGRPGIVRVVKGSVIEYRGSTARTLNLGDTWYENADTVHWFRNPSATEPAELWVVDLVPKKK